jgi:hypothetical protein
MGQEISVSYQAVKSKVYKLIDALVEGSKTPTEVQESIQRWWGMVHPADRAVAHKYMLAILHKSNIALANMTEGLQILKDFENQLDAFPEKAKLHSLNGHHQPTGPFRA